MVAEDRVNWRQSVTAVKGMLTLISPVHHIKSIGPCKGQTERVKKMMEEVAGIFHSRMKKEVKIFHAITLTDFVLLNHLCCVIHKFNW